MSNETYSLALKGGLVVDGSGASGFKADVGVDGDRIVAVDRDGKIRGRRELDCRGLVVAPGFIDTHSHSDLMLLANPSLPMKVRQGITLEVLGQDGISVAPLRPEQKEQRRRQLAGLLGDPDIKWSWESVDQYLDLLERSQMAPDCAYLVPHGAIRECVMGMEDRKATEDELARMIALLEACVKQGAIGVSTGLIYPPCCYADTDELIALARKAAELDVIFAAHIRSESDKVLEAVREIIQIARRSGVRAHISHFKIAGSENFSKIDRMLSLVRSARSEGLKLTADQYPYVAGSTMLGAMLPPWAHQGGVEATLKRLADSQARALMRQELESRQSSDWDNFWKWHGAEGFIISDVPSGRNSDLVGKTLAEAARLRGKDPLEFAFDLLLEERMGVAIVSFSQSEEIVQRIMREPYVNVCTDGLLGGKPHPRAYGTYPRMLGRYARELKVLTLEEAVRKMTSQAAEAFKLRGYGYVREGGFANLVAFDPEAVIDEATYEDPLRFPRGIAHVVVRGTAVVRDGEQTSALPGKIFRGSNTGDRTHA